MLVAGWALGGAVAWPRSSPGCASARASSSGSGCWGGSPGPPRGRPGRARPASHPLAALESMVEPPDVQAATYEAAGMKPEQPLTDPAD